MIPKFRAWWIQDEVMTNIYTLEFLQGGIRVSDGCWHEKFLGDEVILMQSTGLKDKNDVEIFEGDIVRVFEYGRYGGTYNAPVSWISYSNEGEQWAFHGFTCIGVKEIEHHSEVESLFTRGFLTRQFGSCVQLSELTKDPRNSIKVIGNIYENPELLNLR
ncbi:YopX family protein [Enterococcus hermanniensis]|nr:YopX family protein [Enterococcus hermanniensis]